MMSKKKAAPTGTALLQQVSCWVTVTLFFTFTRKLVTVTFFHLYPQTGDSHPFSPLPAKGDCHLYPQKVTVTLFFTFTRKLVTVTFFLPLLANW